MPGLPFEVLYTIHFKDVFRISGNWVGVTQETIATFLEGCQVFAKLHFRDIMGYLLMVFFLYWIITSLAFLFFIPNW
jgi:hypothetical protein